MTSVVNIGQWYPMIYLKRVASPNIDAADRGHEAFVAQVYAIGAFIPQHPGGFLIRRAIGEDATEHLGRCD